MAKIAVVAESMKMGGTEVAILALIKMLKKNKHDVTLYLIGKHGPLLERIPKEVKVKEIKFKKLSYKLLADSSLNISKFNLLYRVKRKLLKIKFKKSKNIYKYILEGCIVDNEKYDLVCDAFGYGRFTTPYAAVCLNGRKKALWFHDENLHWINKSKEYFNCFDKFFCVSNSVKSELIKKEKIISNKCEVLHNFIEVEDIIKKSNEQIILEYGDRFNILTIARLEEQKGIDISIQAAKILHDKNIKFCWYVIGNGSLRKELKDKIKELHLDNNFVLLGARNNPYPYLKKCDLYVQSSRHEGYPITLIEARALLCPIIATNIPSISEQIINEKNGFLVELDPVKFSNKIENLINNPDKRKKVTEYLKSEKIDFSSDLKKINELLKGETYGK